MVPCYILSCIAPVRMIEERRGRDDVLLLRLPLGHGRHDMSYLSTHISVKMFTGCDSGRSRVIVVIFFSQLASGGWVHVVVGAVDGGGGFSH